LAEQAFRAALIVEGAVIVEVKSVSELAPDLGRAVKIQIQCI
jgi:hypothetical protein